MRTAGSDYRRAPEIILRVNLLGFCHKQFALAAIHGQLGRLDAAHSALQELSKTRPALPWCDDRTQQLERAELIEHLIEGLRKAGLEISSE